jgi:hypothetical protein
VFDVFIGFVKRASVEAARARSASFEKGAIANILKSSGGE